MTMSSDHRPQPPNRNARALEPSDGAGSGRMTNTSPAEPLAVRTSRKPSNGKGSSALASQTAGYGAEEGEDPDLAATLTRMQAAGLVLRAEGERLHYRSPVPLTATQLEFLRQHKAELLRLLTSPPIAPQDHDAIQEAAEERAAIRQLDGGEPCEVAEQQARAAMRVYQYRITDKPTSWLTLIAPGCDLDEARRLLARRFHSRLIEVIEHRAAALRAGGFHTPCSLPEPGRDD